MIMTLFFCSSQFGDRVANMRCWILPQLGIEMTVKWLNLPSFLIYICWMAITDKVLFEICYDDLAMFAQEPMLSVWVAQCYVCCFGIPCLMLLQWMFPSDELSYNAKVEMASMSGFFCWTLSHGLGLLLCANCIDIKMLHKPILK